MREIGRSAKCGTPPTMASLPFCQLPPCLGELEETGWHDEQALFLQLPTGVVKPSWMYSHVSSNFIK